MRWWISRGACALLVAMACGCAEPAVPAAPERVAAVARALRPAGDAAAPPAGDTAVPLPGDAAAPPAGDAATPLPGDAATPLPGGEAGSGGSVPPDGGSSGSAAAELASCCVAASGPGCAEAAVATCLCDIDPFCCSERHDALCVREAVSSCGLVCPPPPASNGCCTASAAPGCSAAPVLACVCQLDPACCQLRFDQSCVHLAAARCGATCESEGAP